jgi:hypothetical protein
MMKACLAADKTSLKLKRYLYESISNIVATSLTLTTVAISLQLLDCLYKCIQTIGLFLVKMKA